MSFNPKISQIIYGSYVKIDRLSQITYETFSNTSIAEATELNIFIDLYSTLHPIFSEHYRVNIDEYSSITSGIINMCGHYRTFFKRLGVKTKFFLVFSYNTCDINRKFIAGYNESFFRKSQIKMFNELAENNFDMLNIICPYLPDIFFVKSEKNYESSVIIANIIETLNDGNPNLIISRDIYPLQLCALYPYTSYLYPKKSREYGDVSIMIPLNEKSNFRESFWNLYSFSKQNQFKSENLYNISPLNFPLVASLNGFLPREITTLYNIHTTKYILNIITNGLDIKISELSNENIYNDEIVDNLNLSIINSRLKALDINFALSYYKIDNESKYNFINTYDIGAINHINSKYFSNNPLDINKL